MQLPRPPGHRNTEHPSIRVWCYYWRRFPSRQSQQGSLLSLVPFFAIFLAFFPFGLSYSLSSSSSSSTRTWTGSSWFLHLITHHHLCQPSPSAWYWPPARPRCLKVSHIALALLSPTIVPLSLPAFARQASPELPITLVPSPSWPGDSNPVPSPDIACCTNVPPSTRPSSRSLCQ